MTSTLQQLRPALLAATGYHARTSPCGQISQPNRNWNTKYERARYNLPSRSNNGRPLRASSPPTKGGLDINITRQALEARIKYIIEDVARTFDVDISTDDAVLQEQALARLEALLADLRSPTNPYNLASGEAVTAADVIEDLAWSIDPGISTDGADLQKQALARMDSLLADLRSPTNLCR